jgi:hypothetical protein
LMSHIHLSTPGAVRNGARRPRRIGPKGDTLVAVPTAEQFTLVAALSGHVPGDSINR